MSYTITSECGVACNLGAGMVMAGVVMAGATTLTSVTAHPARRDR